MTQVSTGIAAQRVCDRNGRGAHGKGLQAMLAIIALLFAGALVVPVPGESRRELLIELTAEAAGSLQVFFDTGQGFSEAASAIAAYPAGKAHIALAMPDASVRSLRLDPPAGSAALMLHDARISTGGGKIELASARGLNEVTLSRLQAGVALQFVAGSRDPQILLSTSNDVPTSRDWTRVLALSLRIAVLTGLLGIVLITLGRFPVPTAACLFAALVMIAALAMGASTQQPLHPDEENHLAAGRYYVTHTVPPAASDPAIVDTYSVYGASYLNQLDVVYLFAGKTARFWEGLGLHDEQALRLFNVMLFGVLVVIAWCARDARLLLALLLVTPQAWYTYGYFNADAFPLFLSFVVVLLGLRPDSAIGAYLESRRSPKLPLLLFVAALGCLLVSKVNYLPVVVTTALVLCARHVRPGAPAILIALTGIASLMAWFILSSASADVAPWRTWLLPSGAVLLGLAAVLLVRRVWRDRASGSSLLRLGTLLALACMIALPRFVVDRVVNGDSSQKAASLVAVAERTADPQFKPSLVKTDLASAFQGLHLAERGIGLGQILEEPYDWDGASARSALGVYGFMNIVSSPWLYWASGLGLLCCVGLLAAASALTVDGRLTLAVVMGGAILVALSSLLHSWVNDFQAQGRYLLPILPILGVLALSQIGIARSRIWRAAILFCFACSMVSFAGVGLAGFLAR